MGNRIYSQGSIMTAVAGVVHWGSFSGISQSSIGNDFKNKLDVLYCNSVKKSAFLYILIIHNLVNSFLEKGKDMF